ncbi:Protein of unknown function [Pseudarcicella hirudinis]|uniref:RNA-binding protein n=1 Tax=Pseudarcicella hirudinis TaxID=1079859 RepID=A0A1I5QCL5_9BACT|nr:DUF721 domain-containing protein [Pseudarcicella hirudinis]SFP43973.1 Protein of unknown function [Pseudarcicella hirudinis]
MSDQYYRFNKDNVRRKTGTISLKEAIDDLLNLYKLRGKYNETYIVAYWEKIMGKPIASRTSKIYVSEGKLFIQIDSAPLRSELLMAKNKIIQLINQEIGEEMIREVIFI